MKKCSSNFFFDKEDQPSNVTPKNTYIKISDKAFSDEDMEKLRKASYVPSQISIASIA